MTAPLTSIVARDWVVGLSNGDDAVRVTLGALAPFLELIHAAGGPTCPAPLPGEPAASVSAEDANALGFYAHKVIAALCNYTAFRVGLTGNPNDAFMRLAQFFLQAADSGFVVESEPPESALAVLPVNESLVLSRGDN